MAEPNEQICPVKPIDICCQPVPPISFDASLSPYEAMYKLLYKVNELVDAANNLQTQITDIDDKFTEQITTITGQIALITTQITQLQQSKNRFDVVELNASNPAPLGDQNRMCITIPTPPDTANLNGYTFATVVTYITSGTDNLYMTWGNYQTMIPVFKNLTQDLNNLQPLIQNDLCTPVNSVCMFTIVENNAGSYICVATNPTSEDFNYVMSQLQVNTSTIQTHTQQLAGTQSSGLLSLINTANSEIDDLTGTVATLNTTVDTHTNQLAGTSSSGLLTQINSTNSTVTTHTQQLAGTSTSGLKSLIDDNKNDIEILESEYSTLLGKMSHLDVYYMQQSNLTVVGGTSFYSITPPATAITDGYSFVLIATEEINAAILGIRVDTGGIYEKATNLDYINDNISTNAAPIYAGTALLITWCESTTPLWRVTAANYSQQSANATRALNTNLSTAQNNISTLQNNVSTLQTDYSNIIAVQNTFNTIVLNTTTVTTGRGTPSSRLTIEVPTPSLGYEHTSSADYIGYVFFGFQSQIITGGSLYAYIQETQSQIIVTYRGTQVTADNLFNAIGRTFMFIINYGYDNAIQCEAIPLNNVTLS